MKKRCGFSYPKYYLDRVMAVKVVKIKFLLTDLEKLASEMIYLLVTL